MCLIVLLITENTNQISNIERDSDELHRGFKIKHSKKVYRKLNITINKRVTVQICSQKYDVIHFQCLMNFAHIRIAITVKRQNYNVHDMFFAKIYDRMFHKEQD